MHITSSRYLCLRSDSGLCFFMYGWDKLGTWRHFPQTSHKPKKNFMGSWLGHIPPPRVVVLGSLQPQEQFPTITEEKAASAAGRLHGVTHARRSRPFTKAPLYLPPLPVAAPIQYGVLEEALAISRAVELSMVGSVQTYITEDVAHTESIASSTHG